MCEICESLGRENGVKQDSQKPWAPDPVNKALPSWESHRDKMEAKMLKMGLGDYMIDEVAIMFDNRARLGEFVSDAVMGDGVKLFNRAFDQVKTWPWQTAYEVEYFFLETRSTMRVECMALNNGMSPLHFAVASHMTPNHPLSVVHMSFKTADSTEYEKVNDILEARPEATKVQVCTSTYGAFTYWHIVGELGGIYLKPRVNLRDNVVEIDVTKTVQDMAGRGDFGMPGLGKNVRPFTREED